MNKWNLKTEIQPMREESNYYDTESGLYYANGSYYDSTVGLHVDAVKISSVIENAFTIFGLDINGIMCDNILAYVPNVYSVFTALELSANPDYDPDENKPWWELAWNAVMRWFASILQAYNDLDIGWKIGIGVALFAIACIITAVTTALTGGTAAIALTAIRKMIVTFLVGIATGMAISAAIALINGESLPDALLNGLADGIFWGGVFAFVSASVNAVKAGIRSSIAKEPKSVVKDGVEIQKANRADFTDEAWKEIQSLPHNSNGETISNMASGRKIHKGFKAAGEGKEYFIRGVGRADYFDKTANIIYELKPNNATSIARGIKQLHKYNQALGNTCKMVLVLY